MTRIWGTLIGLVAVVLIVAGCGGGGDSGDASSASEGEVRLTHVDGAVTITGDDISVTPETGSAVTLAIGPAVARGPLQALVAAGTKARVFYAERGEPIAAKVEAAPTVEDGAKTIDGQITKVSKSSITIQPDGGDARTFTILDEDASAFDTEHLEEHESEGSAVRIYYVPGADGDNAVAYEDA